MALVNVSRKPLTAKARQFDGTLAAFLDIIGARAKNNLSVTCRFNDVGDFVGIQLSNSQGMSLAVAVGDWVVFPDNLAELPMVVDNAHSTSDWLAV